MCMPPAMCMPPPTCMAPPVQTCYQYMPDRYVPVRYVPVLQHAALAAAAADDWTRADVEDELRYDRILNRA